MSISSATLARGSFIAVFALAVAGCNKNTAGLAPESAAGPAQTATMAAMAPGARTRNAADTLAYEHSVAIETAKEHVQPRLRALEAACNADAASGCTILEVSLHHQQELPTGTIRMRLAAAGVEALVELASKDGSIVARDSRAEDLAEPVADTERQLALLTLHRDRLTELMKHKDLGVDQLITVSKELATVQSQIDALGSQRANLRRRIDTDLLTIRVSPPMHAYIGNNTPVMDALRSMGADFREAVAMVIRFIAVLLPWLVVILPGLFLLRMFWRWAGRRLARSAQ